MTRVAVRDDEPFAGEERDARERLRRVLARLDTVEDESTTSDDAARAVRDVEDDLTRELAAAMLAAALAGWRRVRRLLAGAGVDVDRLPADELPARVRERVTARADRLAAAAADGVRDRLGRALDVPAGPDRAAELRRQLDIIDSTLADRTALAATQDAAGVAQQDAADTAEVGEFRWETMRDERVRDSHAAQDGAVRPRGERFPNGLRWPGDTDGPVEEWINCVPGDTRLVAGGAVQRAFRRSYEGPLVRVATAAGHELTVTPNHPVLTEHGWVAAGKLREGDHVVRSTPVDRTSGHPHEDDDPPSAEEVYAALADLSAVERVRLLSVDFHGDGADGEVDVVAGAWGLPFYADAPSADELGEFVFAAADEPVAGSEGASDAGVIPLAGAAPGGVGGSDQALPLGLGSAVHAGLHGRAASAGFDAGSDESSPHGAAVHAEVASEGEFGLAAAVALDEIVGVEAYAGSCHVYNLETSANWYSANGIVLHNCRCQLMPVVPEHDRPAREAAMASSEQAVDVVARAVEAALRIRPWPDATGEVGMVALAPSDEDAQRLAVDGGTPADRLHMTLAVVEVGDHDPAMIRALLAFYAEQHVDQLMAMPARVSGVARFAAADTDSQPVVALVQDDPQRGWDHLASVREWIASDLETRGHAVRRNHEPWTPHITLGVTALDDDEQLPAVDAGPITFDRLVVAVGDDWRVFPLASPDGEAVLRQFPGEFPFASHTECVERMTGEVDDPDAFCNAWKTESGMRSRSVAWKSRDRRIVEGPVLVPGEPDAKGDTLTADEVAAIAHTFLEHGGLHDVEHDFAARSGVKPIESYVLDEPRGDLPAGTWMLAARVTDPQLVADIDAGRLRGWSVTATHAHAAARLAGRIAASTRSLPGGVREVGLADLDDPQAITVTLTGSPAVPKALWTSIKHRARSVAERVFPPARTVPDAQHGDAESHADPGDDMQTEEITAAVKAALGDALEPIEQRLAAVEAAQHSNPTDPSDPPESTPTDPGSGEGEGAAKSTGEPSSEGEATAAAVKAAIEGALEDKLAPLADRIERVEKSLPVASRKALGQDPAPHRDDAAGKTDGETYRRPYRDAQGRRIDHKQEA